MLPFIACFALLASSATRQLRCRAGHTSLHTPRLPGLVERSPIHLHRCCLYRERSIFESFRCLGVRFAVEDLEQEQPPDKSGQAHRPNNSTKIDMSPVLGAQSERVLAVDLPQLRALSFEKSVKPRLVVTDRHKASYESHGIQDTVTRDELPTSPRAAFHECCLTRVCKHTHTHPRIHACIRTFAHTRTPTISLSKDRSSCLVLIGGSLSGNKRTYASNTGSHLMCN